MQTAHTTGGTIGGVLGIVLTALLHHYGVTALSDVDAAAIGLGMAAAGIAVAHALWMVGVVPIVRRIVHGPPSPPRPPEAG